ncbi:MAG: hypothetical protein ACQESN_05165 [Thermotogota bacterium]
MYFVPFEFSNYKAFLMETINKVVRFVDKNFEDIDQLYKLGKKKSYYIMFLIDSFGTNFLANYELAELLASKYADPEKERQNPIEVLQRFYVDLFVKISEKSHFPKEEVFEKAFSNIFEIFLTDYQDKLNMVKEDYKELSKKEIIEKLFKSEYDDFNDVVPTYNILIFHSIHTDNKESAKFMLEVMSRAIKEHENLKQNENKKDYSVEEPAFDKIREENEFLKKENEELKSVLKNVYAKLDQVI